MSKKQKQPSAPRQVGALTVTEPVYARRKWSRTPPAADQPQLFGASSASSEGKGTQPAAAADRSAAPRREHRAAAAGGGPLFQSYGHCCDRKQVDAFPDEEVRVYSPEDVGKVVGQEYRIRPCHCRRWFCEWCGPRLGVKLRERLIARLKAFTNVYGVTLTVDGSLFACPEQAWLYVMEGRLLSRFVRDLHRRDYLHSKAYFWSVEFQKQTEQPHWHVLVDATYVPYGQLVEIWSRFRPATAAQLVERITAENYHGKAPALGSVRYTESPNREKAGFYTTKYLTKYPYEGYPAWVLDREGRMPRFGHSHRFFPRVSSHDPMCFCAECRGEEEPRPKSRPKPKQVDPNAVPVRREGATIRKRLEQCGQTCTIVQVKRVQLADGTVVDGRGKYEGKLELSFREACELLGIDPADRWQLELDGPTVTELEDLVKVRNVRREAA